MKSIVLVFLIVSCASYDHQSYYTPKVNADIGISCDLVPAEEVSDVYEFELFKSERDCRASEYFSLLREGYLESEFKFQEEKALKNKKLRGSLYFNTDSQDHTSFYDDYIIIVDIRSRFLSCIPRIDMISKGTSQNLKNNTIVMSNKGYKNQDVCTKMITNLSSDQIVSNLRLSGLIEKLRIIQIKIHGIENPSQTQFVNSAINNKAKIGMSTKMLFLAKDFPEIGRAIASVRSNKEGHTYQYDQQLITIDNNRVTGIEKLYSY